MTQNLGDTLKGHPAAEHPRGSGVAKLMSRPQREMSPTTRPADNGLDPLATESPEGGSDLQEHPPGGRGWPCLLEVAYHRLADIFRKGQPIVLRALSAYPDLAAGPVHVTEFEGCHLSSPQTQPGQEKKDGMVPQSDRGLEVTTAQKLLDLFPRDVLG